MNYEQVADAIGRDEGISWYLAEAVRYSEKYNLDTLTFHELPWSANVEAETEKLIEQLKKYDVREFWISEASTALNKALIRLMGYNVVITGGEVLKVSSPYFSWEEEIPVLKCEIWR